MSEVRNTRLTRSWEVAKHDFKWLNPGYYAFQFFEIEGWGPILSALWPSLLMLIAIPWKEYIFQTFNTDAISVLSNHSNMHDSNTLREDAGKPSILSVLRNSNCAAPPLALARISAASAPGKESPAY